MTTTIREQALEALVQLFATMSTSSPASDPYTTSFDLVQRAPLDEKSWRNRASMSIHDTGEQVSYQVSKVDRMLTVVCEFRCTIQTGEDPSTVGNRILGDIQRRLWENKTLGGLVIDVIETQNEMYVKDLESPELEGAIWLKVQYRTRPSDPRYIN